MTFDLGIVEISVGVFLLGILQFLASLWISERLKASLRKENSVFLENLKWEFKAREQAEKVAQYMAIARELHEKSSPEEYREANRLAWELAMWLPADVYRAMGQALVGEDSENNPLSVVIKVRKVLLGDTCGDLTQDHIIHHAPGIGRKRGYLMLCQMAGTCRIEESMSMKTGGCHDTTTRT